MVLAAATERGLLDREELAGEFLAPLSSPQGRQGSGKKRLSHEKEHISFYGMNGWFCMVCLYYHLCRFFEFYLMLFLQEDTLYLCILRSSGHIILKMIFLKGFCSTKTLELFYQSVAPSHIFQFDL